MAKMANMVIMANMTNMFYVANMINTSNIQITTCKYRNPSIIAMKKSVES